MNSKELRQKFLKFFEEKGHKVIPSASLVPSNDPTVLFTTAGMHPLVPFLLGEKHPNGTRLVNYQKCLRTDDIEEVGDDTHNTFFEMLGNWSFGDYWKDDAIKWSFEFLTDKKWLGLETEKLAVTVFEGDKNASQDDESVNIWKSLGFTDDRIKFLGKKDNWWGPAGATGPCGPDTEMFYWTGTDAPPAKFDPEDKHWVEIWNNVFMQYNKTSEGKFEPLKQKNVDTGMGIERTAAALEGKTSIYETELFAAIIERIRLLAAKQDLRSERIIADHMRAAVFLLADGVTPSNKDRGYILRRLIRRGVTHGQKLGIDHDFTAELAEIIISEYEPIYPELKNTLIEEELKKEETKFRITLGKGLKLLEGKTRITGEEAFDLMQSYGFPIELIREFIRGVDYSLTPAETVIFEDQFSAALLKHQELSRTASAGQFKGGLSSHTDKVVRLHTVTHLMNAALRKILGQNVWQKGSNITEERTRFDFTHDKKMTDEEKRQTEELVNEWIARDLSVKKEILPLEDARKLGAIGVFGEKYPDTVSVYTIYDPKTEEVVSREFCGGPHVEHTGIIGKFRIQKEEAVASGVRRIKATIE